MSPVIDIVLAYFNTGGDGEGQTVQRNNLTDAWGRGRLGKSMRVFVYEAWSHTGKHTRRGTSMRKLRHAGRCEKCQS